MIIEVSFFIIFIFSLIFLKKETINNKISKIKKVKKNSCIKEYIELVEKKNRDDKETYKLAMFCYTGIDDSNKLYRITPNLKKALVYFKRLLDSPYKYDAMMKIGDIYHFSYTNYEYLIDPIQARQYYKLIIELCPDINLRNQAYEKIIQLNVSQGMPSHSFLIQKNTFQKITDAPVEDEIFTNSNIGDSQNVHDTAVVNSIKNYVKNERIEVGNGFEKLSNIIKSYKCNYNKELSNTRIKNALKVLKTMNMLNSHVNSISKDEREIIDLVGQKYENLNDEEKENFRHNLVLQLSDTIEFDNVVCSQGRVYRLLNSLPDLNIKPIWAIKQEMINKAPVIRKRMLSEYDNIEKEIIENPKNDIQHEISNKFEIKFKNELKKEYKKDYVDTKLIDNETLNTEIDSWYI